MKSFEYNGIEIPKLGLGTWKSKGQDCQNAVCEGLKMGYRHIDTAQIYDNEEAVGAGINDSGITRSDIFLTTKVWRDKVGKSDLQNSVEESLGKLKTDYVDLLLLHWPVNDVPLEEQLDALQNVQKQGLTKLIGVSNYPVDLLKRVREELNVDIATDQVEYHPFLTQDNVLGYLKDKGMFLTAYSPLAQGEVLQNTTLKEIGLKYGLNPVQVAILWEYQQENVVTIPKSDKIEHMKSNLEAIEQELSEEDMQKISELQSPKGRLIDPDFAPEWDAA